MAKKPILCNTCKLYELAVLVDGKSAKVIEECYWPSNHNKAGTATICEEYEEKDNEPTL